MMYWYVQLTATLALTFSCGCWVQTTGQNFHFCMKYFQNSYFYLHIWIQHENCIQMSTNKPSIDSLVLIPLWFCKDIGTHNLLCNTSHTVSLIPLNVDVACRRQAKIFIFVWNIFKNHIYICIYGFSMKIAFKWVQTSLVLVPWFWDSSCDFVKILAYTTYFVNTSHTTSLTPSMWTLSADDMPIFSFFKIFSKFQLGGGHIWI